MRTYNRMTWAAVAALFASAPCLAFVPPTPVPDFAVPPAAAKPFPGAVNNQVTRVLQNRATAAGVAAGDIARVNTVRGVADSATRMAQARSALGAAGRSIGWLPVLLAIPTLINQLQQLDDGTPATEPDGSTLPSVGFKSLGNATEGPGVSQVGGKPTLVPAFSTGDPKTLRSQMFGGQGRPLKTCWGMTGKAVSLCVGDELRERYKITEPQAPPLAYLGIRCTGSDGSACSNVFQRPRYIHFDSTWNKYEPRAEVEIVIGIDSQWRFAPHPLCETGVAFDYGDSNSGACSDPAPLQGRPTYANNDAPWYVVGGQKNRPLSSQTIADLVNGLWQDAASRDGYNGLPFPTNAPVTAQEVAASRAQNEAAWPTVGDLLAPVSPGAVTGSTVTTVPLPANGSMTAASPAYTHDPASGTLPSTGTQTGTGTGPVTINATVDLGADPAIGAPALPETPTMAAIIEPLFNIFPNLDVEVPNGTCPVYEFDALGEHYVFDQICTIAEQYRDMISVIAVACFAFAAAMVVLRA